MHKTLNISIGQTFGRWTIIEDVGVIKTNRYFLCRCECGVEKRVSYNSLRRGTSLSCGCLAIELIKLRPKKEKYPNTLPLGVASRNSLYSSYKTTARKRNLIFDLSIEMFENITKQNCSYCGVEPKYIQKTQYNTGSYIYNGLDRINNTLGYVPSNVAPCCRRCNVAKNNYSQDSFKQWISSIFHNLELS